MSAADVRALLAVGFVEPVVSQPDVLSDVVRQLRTAFMLSNVSEQRIRQAADSIELDAQLLDMLLA